MSENISITITEPKKEPWYKRITERIKGKTPQTTVEQSDRIKRLGFFEYPKRTQLDLRLFMLMDVLEEIETEYEKIQKHATSVNAVQVDMVQALDETFQRIETEQLTNDKLKHVVIDTITKRFTTLKKRQLRIEELEPYAYRNIKKLFKAFMTIAGPWFKGLDNRELSDKATKFFNLETLVGHLPAFYPDLKECTEDLIHLGWQAIDVVADTPFLLETKATLQSDESRRGIPAKSSAEGYEMIATRMVEMQQELTRLRQQVEAQQ